MKIRNFKILPPLVVALYLITLLVASFHYHEKDISLSQLKKLEQTHINTVQHFFEQNQCNLLIFLSLDNLSISNIKSSLEITFTNRIFAEYYFTKIKSFEGSNKSLRAPPLS